VSRRWRSLHAALVFAGAALTAASAFAAPRRTICTAAFNAPDEIDVFRRLLPAEEFRFVDLTPAAGPDPRPTWLTDACRPDVRCDVVVYSGEFAGRFFGTRPYSLRLQAMEEASCQRRCDGLFHHADEVFLLGCNTLATKSEDRRTPAEYLDVLLAHGFDRTSAETVVATRYGPLGASFRETLRRTFANVPRLYGFGSVAPTSAVTAPMLAAYLRSTDYARHLDEDEGRAAPNPALLRAFRGTSLTQTTGLTPSEPAMRDRNAICALYDERGSVLDRLELARDVMSHEDFLAFVPTLEVFLERHPAPTLDRPSQAVFDDIRSLRPARARVLGLVRDLDVSALKLELAHFALQMGWLTAADLRRVAVDGVKELLRRPVTSEVTDITCAITEHVHPGDAIGADDLSPAVFLSDEGVRLVDCLRPTDPRVTARLAGALASADPSLRRWAAYALSHRLPLDDATLARLAASLDDPLPDVRARIGWTFRAQRVVSGPVLAAVGDRDPGLARELRRDDRRISAGR